MDLKERLLQRFLRYSEIPSQSEEGSKEVPSSMGQWEMAKLLKKDLEELGFEKLNISEHAVVTGYLKARLSTGKKADTVGWVCHMDTVNVGMSDRVYPKVVNCYDGKDICQNEEKQIYMKVEEYPELKDYIGQDLIVSDGTSVLGADNKSAIANVMVAFEILKEHPEIEHGDIYIAFVPDEEVGLCGAKSMDLSLFPVDYAYTIDCCSLGEVVYQTFNAGSGLLEIQGVTAHPMSAKGVLVNPGLVAVDYVNLLNREETPECTENTEGYIWVTGIEAGTLEAKVYLNIRDHNKEKYEQKKELLRKNVEVIQKKYPRAKLKLSLTDVYGNIADALKEDNQKAISNIYQALEELNIPAKTIPMRGGTDGSYLSMQGIVTPNYFTGALNFHSRCEFMPMDSFEKSCLTTLKLIELATR